MGDFGGDHPVRGERAVPTSYANHDMVRRGTRCGPHTPAGAADRSSLGRVPTDRQRRRRKSTAPAVDTDIILRIRPMSLLPHFSQSVLGGRSSVALSCRYITSACPKRHFTRMNEPEVDAHGPGAWSPTRATVRRPSRPQAGASCMTACSASHARLHAVGKSDDRRGGGVAVALLHHTDRREAATPRRGR